jgi:hypothetical protein
MTRPGVRPLFKASPEPAAFIGTPLSHSTLDAPGCPTPFPRIESSDFPLLGFGLGPGHGHFVHFHDLDAAASYLGMSEEELRTALGEGQTLAEIAEARGKPVDGLIDTLVAAATEDLDEAVADGRLTEEQKAEILSNLEERITARVNGERGRGPGWRRFGPPPMQEPESEVPGSTQSSTSLA